MLSLAMVFFLSCPMSSSGTIADMIARIEYNRALLGKHKRYFELMEGYARSELGKKLEWKKLTEDERIYLVERLEESCRQKRKNDIKTIGISVLLTALIILIINALFRWVFL